MVLSKRIKKLELILLDLASRKDRCKYIYQSDLIEVLAKRKVFSKQRIQAERTKKMSKWYRPPKCKKRKEIWKSIDKLVKLEKEVYSKKLKALDKLNIKELYLLAMEAEKRDCDVEILK